MAARRRWATGVVAIVQIAVGGLVLVALPARAHAASWPDEETKAFPCRPTIACTAELTAPGTLEVESGGYFARNHAGDRALSFPFLLKQTITPLLQLQVGSNGYSVLRGAASARYFDNVLFGPKLHLLNQAEFLPALAITAQMSVPTFAATGYERHDNVFFTGHVTKDVGALHADLNGGANIFRIDTTTATQGFATIALSTTIAGPIGGALETYWFSKALPAAPRDGGVRAVLNATLRPWLVLDLGGDIGYYPKTRAFSVFFGMVIVPAVLWQKRT